MTQIFTSFSKEEFQEMLQKSVDLALNKEAKEKSTVNAQKEFVGDNKARKLHLISKSQFFEKLSIVFYCFLRYSIQFIISAYIPLYKHKTIHKSYYIKKYAN